MTLEQLGAVLGSPESGTNIFTLSSQSVTTRTDADWSKVAALLALLSNGTLAVTCDAGMPQTTATTIAYIGTGTLFPWTALAPQPALRVSAVFSVDGDGNPALIITTAGTASTTITWTLADSLDGLALWIDDGNGGYQPSGLLGSVFFNHPAYTLESSPALSTTFAATLVPTGAWATAATLFPLTSAFSVSGDIDISRPGFPVLDLHSDTTVGIMFGTLNLTAACHVAADCVDMSLNGSGNYFSNSTTGQAATATVGGVTLEFAIPLSASGDILGLELTNGPITIGSLDDLKPLVGNANLASMVTSSMPRVSGYALNSLSIEVESTNGVPSSGAVSFDVSLTTGDWHVLPSNILTVRELGVRGTVAMEDSLALSGALYGRTTVGGVADLQAEIAVPSLAMSVALDDGTTFPLLVLMQQMLTGITGMTYTPPASDMTVRTLDLSVDILNGQFGAAADITTDWTISFGDYNGKSLVQLQLVDVRLNFEYEGSELSCGLSASFQLSYTNADGSTGHTLFYLDSQFASGTNGGWSLAASMANDETLSVSALLQNFMYPSGVVPGTSYGIPSMEISGVQMGMDLSTSGTLRSFSLAGQAVAAWTFSPSANSSSQLKLAASLDVTGTRTLTGSNPGAWAISGSVSGMIDIFGLAVTAGYTFAPNNGTLNFSVFYKNRGISAVLTQVPNASNAGVKDSILTLNFGDLSLGEILGFLIGLAAPGTTVTLPSPWDVLYSINFRNLQLKVNLSTYDIAITYALNLNLAVMHITGIGLLYQSVNGEGAVYMQLYGTFLGQQYTQAKPLQWDVMNEAAPPVPGVGAGLIDITYMGAGQHVALPQSSSQLTNVTQVLTALKNSMKPVSGTANPLSTAGSNGMHYDTTSNWLFGMEASLLEGAILFAGVFYDPRFYGGKISLNGARMKSLSGLDLELSYRKLREGVGQFSFSLALPFAFRHLDIGEASITLGVVHIDVGTNGTFFVNMGFPDNMNFRNSFQLSIFPFAGSGGFYLGSLDGPTTTRVPAITNGSFSPVLVAGLGLMVTLGKDYSCGPFEGRLTLDLQGTFEGLVAPFFPNTPNANPDTYYWVQGVAAVVGTLSGSVDLYVASVSAVAGASVTTTLTFEAHQPTTANLSIRLHVAASLDTWLGTVDGSFNTTVSQTISFGTRSTPAWTLASSASSSRQKTRSTLMVRPGLMQSSRTVRQPQLARQTSLYAAKPTSRLSVARLRMSEFESVPALRAGLKRKMLSLFQSNFSSRTMTLAKVSGSNGAWTPAAVFGEGTPKTVRVYLSPGFTASVVSGMDRELVLQVVIENALPSDNGAHSTDENGLPSFSVLAEAFLRWAAAAGADAGGTDVISRVQLQDILDDLLDPEVRAATFSYNNLADFFSKSVTLQFVSLPSTTVVPPSLNVTSFPMPPTFSGSVIFSGVSTVTVDFNTAGPGEQFFLNLKALRAYADPYSDPMQFPDTMLASDSTSTMPSAARHVFSDYFTLLTKATLQAALNMLDALPYTYPASNGPSLNSLASSFVSLDVSALVTVGVTAESIAQDNYNVALATGRTFTATGLKYQTLEGQTLSGVAAAVPRATASLTAQAIAAENSYAECVLRTGATITIPAFTYTSIYGDTQSIVDAIFQVRTAGPSSQANAAWFAQAVIELNSQVTNWETVGDTLRPLYAPTSFGASNGQPHVYYTHNGDTLGLIAATLSLLDENGVLLGAPADAPVSFSIAAMQHTVTSTDTFDSLVTLFPGLTLEALVAANASADILTPLAALALPDFTAETAAGDTIETLSAALGCTQDDLVGMVANVSAIFTGETQLTIRDVAACSVNDLASAMHSTAVMNQVSGQVSNFMLHGQTVPCTGHEFETRTPRSIALYGYDGATQGMYAFTGQQVVWPPANRDATYVSTPQELALAMVALADANSPSWITYAAGEVSDGSPLTATQQANNPGLTDDDVFAGMVLLAGAATTASVVLDPSTMGSMVPPPYAATTVTVLATPLYADRPQHINLQNCIDWQAAEEPVLPAHDSNETTLGPTIWPFSPQLLQVAIQASETTYGLFSLPASAPPDTEGTERNSYTWGSLVPFEIARVAIPNTASRDASTTDWVPGTYQVAGASGAAVEVLYALWTSLKSDTAGSEAQAFLLYGPDQV